MRTGLIGLLMLGGCWTGSTTKPASEVAAEPPRERATPARPDSRAEPRCDLATAPPVRATSDGQLRFELPRDDRLVAMSLVSSAPGAVMASQVRSNTGLATSVALAPGTYTIELETAAGTRVRCEGVPVAAGGETTVTIVP